MARTERRFLGALAAEAMAGFSNLPVEGVPAPVEAFFRLREARLNIRGSFGDIMSRTTHAHKTPSTTIYLEPHIRAGFPVLR